MARDAKTRQHNRKRAHKELGARRTEASRKRRLDNKAKRDEIHAINPDVKVKIINEKTYIDGWEFAVENGKLVCKELTEIVNEQRMAHLGTVSSSRVIESTLPEGAIKTECDFEDAIVEYQEVMDEEECIKALDFALTSKEGDKYPTNKEPTCELPQRSAFQRLKDKIRGS